MKNILIAEGNPLVRSYYKDFFNSPNGGVTHVSNICDLIYYVFYTDTIFDTIIIGDEMMETNLYFGVDNEVDKELEKLKNCKYYPVTLGEICKELSKKVGKPEPDVIIVSTFSYYPFHGNANDAKEFIDSKHMEWIDKIGIRPSNDFMNNLRNKIINKIV